MSLSTAHVSSSFIISVTFYEDSATSQSGSPVFLNMENMKQIKSVVVVFTVSCT